MITIDIDILNNLKVLKTILGEIDEEHSWRICFNATPENEHWKDYPNKCARYFTFDMERRVFSWKCHDNLSPSDTTHIPTPGHALEFLEGVFSMQTALQDKTLYHPTMANNYDPDILASVSAPDPKPKFTDWSTDGGDYVKFIPTYEAKIPYYPNKKGWNDYDKYGNPCDEVADEYQYYSKIKDQIYTCHSMSDIHYIYGKLAGKHDHVSEKLMDMLMKKKSYLEQKEYMYNMYGSMYEKHTPMPLYDYQANFICSPSKGKSVMMDKHYDELMEVAKQCSVPIITAQQTSKSFTKTKEMTALGIESTHKELSAAAKQIADEIDATIIQHLMLNMTNPSIKPEF